MPQKTNFLPKIVALGVIVAAAMVAGWWLAMRSSEVTNSNGQNPMQPLVAGEKRAVHLYFGDAQGRYLISEQRVIEASNDDAALGSQLINLLVKGPERSDRSRTLPENTRVDAFFITEKGRAYVDFAQGAFDDHPGGVGTEMLSIFSMVNTLILNVDTIRSVKFIIGGREAATLAGHADLQIPYEVDMMWVR